MSSLIQPCVLYHISNAALEKIYHHSPNRVYCTLLRMENLKNIYHRSSNRVCCTLFRTKILKKRTVAHLPGCTVPYFGWRTCLSAVQRPPGASSVPCLGRHEAPWRGTSPPDHSVTPAPKMIQWISESMNKWINEWINESINESMNQRIKESTNQRINRSRNQARNQWVNQINQKNKRINQWTARPINEWIN